MTFFVECPCPRKFAHPEQHLIKGLNAETPARISFPPPAWITTSTYSALRADSENDEPHCAYFSLNLSIYNQTIIPSDWDDNYFLMYGRVHPYTLTWNSTTNGDLETSNDTEQYIIPALIIRDQGYQP
jgi:hypothetical protein